MEVQNIIYLKALELDIKRKEKLKQEHNETKISICSWNGICPNCGSRLRWRKVGFFERLLSAGGNDMMHECTQCDWSRGDAHADAT